MGKNVRMGICALCIVLLASLAAPSFARSEVGKNSYYAYLSDGIAFSSNCLSQENPTVLLPEDTGDAVSLAITLLCEGGDETGTFYCSCDNNEMQVSLSIPGEPADNQMTCSDGAEQTVTLTLTPPEDMTEDATVHVKWEASSMTVEADFVLPAAKTSAVSEVEEEAGSTEEGEMDPPSTPVCYRGSDGTYTFLCEESAQPVITLGSGTFPAFTWYSLNGGESWTVLAYEIDQIDASAGAGQTILLRTDADVTGGFRVTYGNQTYTIPESEIAYAALVCKAELAVMSDTVPLEFETSSTGTAGVTFAVLIDGTLFPFSDLGFENSVSDSGILTLSSPERTAAAGSYTLAATVFVDGTLVETIQTVFFVNYRYGN